jgi:molybdate-binding protein/DNA-binding XRE family transcriptional regulator
MPAKQELKNCVKNHRAARGWSQDELASRVGVSRAGISAIEAGRLVPSAATALALATVFQCRVEDLFSLTSMEQSAPAWAWTPVREPCRYWRAEVRGRTLFYPVEATNLGLLPHDGVHQEGAFHERNDVPPGDTLVLASCDPAIGLLASQINASSGFRLLALQRSSQEALAMLAKGLVHVAGIHLAKAGQRERNAAAARDELKTEFRLLHVARWQEGVVTAPGLRLSSVQAVLGAKLRWVGRETGSAARELLDQLREGQRPPRYIARGHRGVAEAIRSGWADAGVCLRLVSDEAGLDFLGVRDEEYDLCYPAELEGDPRIVALVGAVRSSAYRHRLGDLPGYDSSESGELERIV